MNEKPVILHPRRLARLMAKAALDREKITGYNKERIGPNGLRMPSVFSQNWREIASKAAGVPKRKKKKGARR